MTPGELKWQDLEGLVKQIAQAKFGAQARAEDIAGIKCDCVLHLGGGEVVLIEVSKASTLEKLRTDIAKFGILRQHFLARNILPRCFFITLSEPTPALIESAKSLYVTAQSVGQFLDAMLGWVQYSSVRQRLPFGSAINLYSGKPDDAAYVPVQYISDDGTEYDTQRIASELVRGTTIVLIGDYGSGKSRCIKEVFEAINESRTRQFRNPVAINLRDNWGLKRAPEMITRHFTDLGLGGIVPDALKVAFSQATIYLLDGFDEIGAQTWSDDPTKLVEIRKQSLVGVKDLILQAQGGVLITGREHYFNDDAELITCLGLGRKNPLFLRCNQQLSEQQFTKMIGREALALPPWMPKKPLIATIIRDIEGTTVERILETSSGQIDFWNLLVDTFCEREAKINPILDASIIRSLYAQIGRLSRSTPSRLGPISIRQINEAFEATTGRPPTDESAIILQRLPGLSRIGAESLDRQFVDTYILDGLKAEDVLELYVHGASDVFTSAWRHPVEEFGAHFIATQLAATKQVPAAIAFVKRHRDCVNKVLVSDVVAALFAIDGDPIDLGGYEFERGRFYHVSLSDTSVSNAKLVDCTFDYLDITDAEPRGIRVEQSVVVRLAGIASMGHAPEWFTKCAVESFQSMSTLAAIRQIGLSVSQTFLLSSLRKLFLQPGGGRKASSMYKGYGDSITKRVCDKVIALLIREEFCKTIKGTNEVIYLPNRSKTARVQAMMNQMTMSKDDLWAKVTRLSVA